MNTKTKVMNKTVDLDRYPPQVKYIVGNEACERYSYYGMRSILTVFLVQFLLMTKEDSTVLYHNFASMCYLFPVFGALISDKFWGKYKTILYLSIVYCLGHLYLAVFETNQFGFATGLSLIALGSGGIKPCVSAHVGDQFKKGQETLLNKVFGLFYFMINFGAMFSSFITPWTLDKFGPGIAFGIPGILMAIATVIFWMGRNHFVHVPPAEESPKGFNVMFWGSVALTCLLPIFSMIGFNGITSIDPLFFPLIILAPVFIYGLIASKDKNSFSKTLFTRISSGKEGVIKKHGKDSLEGMNAVFGIFPIFFMVSVFWALFDQQGSTWVLQAKEMNLDLAGAFPFLGDSFNILPSQVQGINPILVMILIPFTASFMYPMLNKFFELTPLRKMTIGMAMAGLSFVVVAMIQSRMDGGASVNVAWQGLPYVIITLAEVMVSITGLEFAYTQAPRSMKSIVMSLWLLTVSLGNQIVSFIVNAGDFMTNYAKNSLGITASTEYIVFWVFAILMFVAAAAFALVASRYKMKNYMED